MKLDKTTKTVWSVQLNTASQILHSALSRSGESVPAEAREALQKALDCLVEADRLVRFAKVEE